MTPSRRRWHTSGLALLATFTLMLPAVTAAAATTPPAPPPAAADTDVCPPLSHPCPYDITRPAWFSGITVTQFAQIPSPFGSGPPAPSPERPDATIYLVGNIGAPFSPAQQIPGGPLVPAHDDVWSRYPSVIVDGFGSWVVPGPAAKANTVRSREQPAGSIVGAPLVYSIKIGRYWVPLNNSPAILYGLQTKQLSLVDAGYGGGGWFIFNQKGL